jgi:hypothetical protein
MNIETTTAAVATPAPEPRKLERVTCSRCGGSGNYSYCQRYGTTCFKCGGAKVVYTKRGAAAAAYLNALLSKPARELKAGDVIKGLAVTTEGVAGQWETVQVVRPQSMELDGYAIVDGKPYIAPGALTIETNKCQYTGVRPDEVYRVAADKATKSAAVDKALEYQDTLTKAGTPRKVK